MIKYKKGTIICCEDDHPLLVANRDIYDHDIFSLRPFYSLVPDKPRWHMELEGELVSVGSVCPHDRCNSTFIRPKPPHEWTGPFELYVAFKGWQ